LYALATITRAIKQANVKISGYAAHKKETRLSCTVLDEKLKEITKCERYKFMEGNTES